MQIARFTNLQVELFINILYISPLHNVKINVNI